MLNQCLILTLACQVSVFLHFVCCFCDIAFPLVNGEIYEETESVLAHELEPCLAVTVDTNDISVYRIKIACEQYNIYTWCKCLTWIGVVSRDVADILASRRVPVTDAIMLNRQDIAEISPTTIGMMRKWRMKKKKKKIKGSWPEIGTDGGD